MYYKKVPSAWMMGFVLVLCGASDATATEGAIGDYLAKPSLNVVITVSDMGKATEFYGDVLGLEPMPPIPFGEKTNPVFFPRAVTMQRFRVGAHEIKLIPGLESTKKLPGGIATAIGFRMVNYPITDVDALMERLAAHGYDKPEIRSMGKSNYRFGMLTDPDGNQVEFYYYEGKGPEGWEESIQIALTVSDVEASRHFYGDILGMQERPPVPMPGNSGTYVYLFQQGPTLIKFWTFGKDLPNHAGRHLDAYGYRYIQFHARDVHATHEFVKSRGATIELPPTPVRSMPVDIMFVADPDGIINEMFGVVVNRR